MPPGPLWSFSSSFLNTDYTKGGLPLSSMDKMWLSFYAMGFMVISMGLIYASRHKLQNKVLKLLFAIVAYSLLIFSFLAMIYLVFNGPTGGA